MLDWKHIIKQLPIMRGSRRQLLKEYALLAFYMDLHSAKAGPPPPQFWSQQTGTYAQGKGSKLSRWGIKGVPLTERFVSIFTCIKEIIVFSDHEFPLSY